MFGSLIKAMILLAILGLPGIVLSLECGLDDNFVSLSNDGTAYKLMEPDELQAIQKARCESLGPGDICQ